jgi:hypothetical protein
MILSKCHRDAVEVIDAPIPYYICTKCGKATEPFCIITFDMDDDNDSIDT